MHLSWTREAQAPLSETAGLQMRRGGLYLREHPPRLPEEAVRQALSSPPVSEYSEAPTYPFLSSGPMMALKCTLTLLLMPAGPLDPPRSSPQFLARLVRCSLPQPRCSRSGVRGAGGGGGLGWLLFAGSPEAEAKTRLSPGASGSLFRLLAEVSSCSRRTEVPFSH